MPTIADLGVRMDVDSAKFRSEITKVQNQIDQLKGKAEETNSILKEFKEAFEFEIVKEAAMKLFEFAKAGGEAADRMSRLSEQVGVEIGALSELSYAAQVTQVGTETLATGRIRMSKSMGQAGDNSTTATRAFKAIGVEIRDSAGKLRDVNQVFNEVAERFSRMEDGATKTAIAVAIFGRGGAELIPMLNKLTGKSAEFAKEAENIGYKLDENAKKAANEFQESLTRMHLAMESLSMQIAVKLSPMFKELADAIVKSDDASKAFKFVVDALVLVFRSVGSVVIGVIADLEVWRDAVGATIAAGILAATGEFTKAKNTLKQGMKDIEGDLERNQKRLEDLWKPPENDEDKWGVDIFKIDPKFQAESSEAERAMKRAFETLEHMVEQHQEKMAKLQNGYEFGAVGEMRYRLEAGDLAKALALVGDKANYFRQKIMELTTAEAQATAEAERNKEAQGAFKALTAEVDNLHAALAKKADGQLAAMIQKIASPEMAANLSKLDAATRQVFIDDLEKGAAEIDKFNARQKELAEYERQDAEVKEAAIAIHKKGHSALEEYNDEVERLNKLLGEGLSQEDLALGMKHAKDKFITEGGEMTDFTKEMSQSISEGFQKDLFDSFDHGLDNMVNSFITALEKMLAAAIAKDILGGILGLGPQGGWGTNALNSLGISIGATDKKAGGGPVQMGQAYMVGEQGPEMFVPAMSGNIVPNGGGTPSSSQTVRHILEVADHGHRTVRDIGEGV